MDTIISTTRNVYTLKFRSSPELYFFSTDEQLNEILKLPQIKFGIDQIKLYNNKDRFMRISKTELKSLFAWNTEAMEIFRKVNFIK